MLLSRSSSPAARKSWEFLLHFVQLSAGLHFECILAFTFSIIWQRWSFWIVLAFLDPKLRNPSLPSLCKLPTCYIMLCECLRRVRSLKGGCYSVMALHYDHFVSLTHRAQTAPEHSAPAQKWWERSTLAFDCQGLYDWFSQSKFRKNPSR